MGATREFVGKRVSGFRVLIVHFVVMLAAIGFFVPVPLGHPGFLGGFFPLLLTFFLMFPGYFTVQPNQARVVIFFGRYVGTVRDEGFWWTNPFAVKKSISLRVRNFDSQKIKVNDAGGNPIEIACVVVWRVVNTAYALFDVEDYEQFVSIQSETALRSLASHYPYDSSDDEDAISLRANQDVISGTLKKEVEARLEIAGVDVLETRLSHLAYAPEIAQAMLRRQQAQAIIGARRQIVEGAVGMVKMALSLLSQEGIVELDEERKATMVNNLLVVLTSEQESQPILNAGSIY